jgi:signal transduction histidine kinase
MTNPTLDLGLLFIFFIYGLSFFGMGIAMALESGRSPALAEARLLRPLALFGILHGVHEWLEFFVVQSSLLGISTPFSIAWVRLGILAASFLALLTYGIQSYRGAERSSIWMVSGLTILCLYSVTILVSAFLSLSNIRADEIVRLIDALVRYLLAVPGALLAAQALRFEAIQLKQQNRQQIAKNLTWAALAFTLYGLTQIFVPHLDMFPANIINGEIFYALTGIPHQAIRTVMAIMITLSLLRAAQLVEKERQSEVVQANQERLTAFQQQGTLRRNLLRHIVRAQEDERARIARELHDETAQTLTAFSLELATLQTMLKRQKNASLKVDGLQNLSRSLSQGLYRLVHDLRPAQLDDLGLEPTLKYLLEQDFRPKGLVVDFELEGSARRVDPLAETVLFRVAQEALNNITRHAQTQRARVRLKFEKEEVTLMVIDQGQGFDISQSFSAPRGWGLAGMRERVESLGGEFHLSSSPGWGTTIEAVVPLNGKQGEEHGNDNIDAG